MTRTTTAPGRPAAPVAIAVLALAFAGCGADSDSEQPDVGPVTAFFRSQSEAWSIEQAQAEFDEREERIAACMNEQGFEYYPRQLTIQDGRDSAVMIGDPGPLSLEYAQQYGYGITTGPLAGERDLQPPESQSPPPADPNVAYLESFSDAQLEAYSTALVGEGRPGVTTPYGLEYLQWQEWGCTGWAENEVRGRLHSIEVQFSALAQDAWQTLEHSATDPRMVEVTSAWSACMAAAGLPGYREVVEPQLELSDESLKNWQEFENSLPADPSPVELDAARARLDEQAEALRQREVATAVADATCRGEVDYDAARREVTVRVEQEFYAAHEAEFEAWRQALAEVGY